MDKQPEDTFKALQAPAYCLPLLPQMVHYGDLMSIKDFADMVRCGAINDDDGIGYWVNKSLALIDMRYSVFRTPDTPEDLQWATHVLWCNK